MAPCATGATFKSTAVKTPVAVDAVITAEGRATCGRTLGISRTSTTDSDVSTAPASPNWTTDTLVAVESTAAVGASRATTTFVAAAVKGSVTCYAIVIAEDRAARLATLRGGSTLSAQAHGSTTSTTSAADSVGTEQTAATDDVPIAGTAVVVAAIQHAVRVNPVRCANRGSG